MSGRSRVPPFSIFDALLGRQAEGSPGATSLLRRLLKVAATVVVDSDLNTLTSYSVVKQARESCDRIDDTIQLVNSERDHDKALQIYHKYVEDIRELERLLYLLLDSDTLPAQPEAVLDVNTVSACLANTPIWEQNRANLHKQLQALQRLRGESSTSAPSWEQRRDDATMLHLMIRKINTIQVSKWSTEMIQTMEQLNPFLPRLEQAASAQPDSPRSPPMENALYAIKTAWLICAALTEKEGSSTSKERKYQLGTPIVWNAARVLCERVNSGRVDGLKAAYEELIKCMAGLRYR